MSGQEEGERQVAPLLYVCLGLAAALRASYEAMKSGARTSVTVANSFTRT